MLIFVAPCSLVLCGLSFREYLRVSQRGAAPLGLTTAEALRRSATGDKPWVLLTDAEFDCSRSAALGGYRAGPALAPGIPEGTTLLLPSPSHDEQCAPAHFEFAGFIAPVKEAVKRRYEEQGLQAGALYELSLVANQSEALVGAYVLLGLGALVLVLGVGWFLKLQANERLRQGRATASEREALVARLARGPLKLRTGFVVARFFVPALLSVGAAIGGGACLLHASREIGEIRSERARWAHARAMPMFGRASTAVQHHVYGSPVLAEVAVIWRDPPAPHIPQRQEYWVLWASDVSPPYQVRLDARGTLTSVGRSLERERYGAQGFLYLLGASLLAGALFFTSRLIRRRREFGLVLRAPQPLYLSFVRGDVLRSYGVETGHVAYFFVARSGETVSQILTRPRAPIFDESGARVLVVTSREDPDAEPILFADDGYPFQ